MKATLFRKVWIFLLVLLASYSIFLLTTIGAFNLLSQSNHTPKEEQLTILNYFFPLLIVIAFILWFTYRRISRKPLQDKQLWLIGFSVIGMIPALSWINQHLDCFFSQTEWGISELFPFFWGMFCIMGLVIEDLAAIIYGAILHLNNFKSS